MVNKFVFHLQWLCVYVGFLMFSFDFVSIATAPCFWQLYYYLLLTPFALQLRCLTLSLSELWWMIVNNHSLRVSNRPLGLNPGPLASSAVTLTTRLSSRMKRWDFTEINQYGCALIHWYFNVNINATIVMDGKPIIL